MFRKNTIVNSNGNKYVFNNLQTYNQSNKYGLNTGYYVFKNISQSHPMALLNNGNFTSLSIYCYYDGYMGGQELLKFSSTCPSFLCSCSL